MNNEYWNLALRIMANVSGWIAFPIILALFIGKWLDRRYDSEPWLFLLSVGISFLVSMYGLLINAIKELKRLEKNDIFKKPENKEKMKIGK